MLTEREKQIFEGQWEEGISMITWSIWDGCLSYKQFMATNPTPKEKKYVDEWLRQALASPEYKNKIIPGFND